MESFRETIIPIVLGLGMKTLLFIVLVSLPWASFSQSNNVIALECEHAKNSRNWRNERDTAIAWFFIGDASDGTKVLVKYDKIKLGWTEMTYALFTADWITRLGLRMPGQEFDHGYTPRCTAINRKTLELYDTPKCSSLYGSSKPRVVGACRIRERDEMLEDIESFELSLTDGNKI